MVLNMAVWKPSWLTDDKNDKKEEKMELPPELKTQFDKVDALDTKVSSIDERLKGLDSITAFVTDIKTRQERADKAAADKIKLEADKNRDDDLLENILTDPKGVINEVTKPQAEAILGVMAENVRRQVFEDREDEFPYYTGDLKKEVNTVLAAQPLAFRNNPASVENVYHTIVGKHMKEINDGKIKSRFASASSNIKGSDKDSKEKPVIELTADIKRMARLTGMSDDDALAIVTRAAEAGELEYV
jgi:hypothetical protein